MQRKNCEYKKAGIFEMDEAREPGLRECWKPIAAVFVVVVMVICGLIGWQWNEAQKLQAAEQARIEGQKAVAAGMVNLPQRTGKTGNQKMVQIPRGTTGQADLVGVYCSAQQGGFYSDVPPGAPPMAAGFGEVWWVLGPDWETVSESASPQGWNVDSDGGVTMPSGAALGDYYAHYATEGTCTPAPPNESSVGAEIKDFRFEVIENTGGVIEFFGGILEPEGDPVNACPGVKLTFGVNHSFAINEAKIHVVSDTGHDAAEAYVYPFTPIAPPDGSEWPGDHGKVKVPQLPAGDYFLHVDCEASEVNGFVDMPFTIPANCPKRRSHMAF